MESANTIAWKSRHKIGLDYCLQQDLQAYDDRTERDHWQKAVYLNARRIAALNGFSRVADFGCGSGYKLMKFLSKYETVGFEIEPALSFLKERYPTRTWLDGSSIEDVDLDSDLVICSDVLEHLDDPSRLLMKFASSSGKIFVLSTPALELLSEKGASRRNGPPVNKSHLLEWSTVEFSNFVLSEMSILSHSIVSLSQSTQMIVACHKGSETAYRLPEFLSLR